MSNAKEKLDRQGASPNQIHDRLTERILDEARTADDEVVAEYVGGVLASSSLKADSGDAGIAWLSLIRQMPAYALRSHYLFYASMHCLFSEQDKVDDLIGSQIFMPLDSYEKSLAVAGEIEEIVSYVIPTFVKEGLVVPTYGQQEGRELLHSHEGEVGFFLTPSRLGAQLFLWGIGLGHVSWRELGSKQLEIGKMLLRMPHGARVTKPDGASRSQPREVDKGWSISIALASPPRIGREALSISVLSAVGTAAEELQLVVVSPDGSEAIGRDRAEMFAQAQPGNSLHLLYPFDFAGVSMDWPLHPGSYRVVAQAIRSSTQGLVPQEIAESQFSVSADGGLTL